jgi:hypothetical protein
MEHDLCKISEISAYVENLTCLKSRYRLFSPAQWVFRYVGKDVAKMMEITYNEYIISL